MIPRLLLGLSLAVFVVPPAAGMIVIDNPRRPTVNNTAGAPVLSARAWVVSAIPFDCGGHPAPPRAIDAEIDLAGDDLLDVPSGTFCRLDLVIDGEVPVVTTAGTYVSEPGTISLVEALPETQFTVRLTGSEGYLVGALPTS